MSPSQNQQGSDTGEYDNSEERFVDNNSDEMLKNIRPHRLEKAKSYLGACNKYDVGTDVKKHFYEEIQRLKE